MQPETPTDPEVDFGILMAPVNGAGTWGALKELRAALRGLSPGRSAKVLFVDALDREGKAISLRDRDVAALVLGYRILTSNNASDPNRAD